MGKERETKKVVTYTVAECSEFHEMGEYHEKIKTISDAKKIYDSIDPKRMNGIRAIGINIHTPGTSKYEDVQWDFYVGNSIDLTMLEFLPEFKECKKAAEALRELVAAYPSAEVVGKISDTAVADNKTEQKTAFYNAELFEEQHGSERKGRGDFAGSHEQGKKR